jgi:hypothetical protein
MRWASTRSRHDGSPTDTQADTQSHLGQRVKKCKKFMCFLFLILLAKHWTRCQHIPLLHLIKPTPSHLRPPSPRFLCSHKRFCVPHVEYGKVAKMPVNKQVSAGNWIRRLALSHLAVQRVTASHAPSGSNTVSRAQQLPPAARWL